MTHADEICVPDDAGKYAAALEALLRRIPPSWGRSLACGPGWYSLVVRVHADIDALVPGYVPVRIKERFGVLAYGIDWSTVAPHRLQVEAITEAAKQESARTCERCSAPGVLQLRTGAVKALCHTCGLELGFTPADLTEAGRDWLAHLNERFDPGVLPGSSVGHDGEEKRVN